MTNPALAVVNGSLYIAFTNYSNTTYLLSTTDGITWSKPYELAPEISTTRGVSLTTNPNGANLLYVGLMNGSSYTPIVCDVYPNTTDLSSSTQDCQNLTNLNQMNFPPGMAIFNGMLYLIYQYRSDSHCVYGYAGYPSSSSYTAWNPNGCNQQTSTQTSVAVYNNYLDIAFGTNDGNRQFLMLLSPDGSTLPYSQERSEGMNGPPNLLPVINSSTGSFVYLVNFYVWNSQIRYMYGY